MIQTFPNQLTPGKLEKWLQIKSDQLILVDVRENDELKIAPFPYQVLHLPLSQSSLWLDQLHEKLLGSTLVVVVCHSGIRSWNFGTWLIEQGWNLDVWNLQGGIDAWSLEIDPSVPRY